MSSDNQPELEPALPAAPEATEPIALAPIPHPAEQTEQVDPSLASEPDSIAAPLSLPEPTPSTRRGVAPIWHMLVLILAILGYSYWAANRTPPDAATSAAQTSAAVTSPDAQKQAPVENPHTSTVRLIFYGLSACVELVMVGWIAIGTFLYKIPFRSLLGTFPKTLNSITLELGVAALFWIISMAVLLVVAVTWGFIQERIYQHQHGNESASHSIPNTGPSNLQSGPSNSMLKAPKQQQKEMIQKLMELAPATGVEVAAWALLCLLVGFSEEIIFRGYIQQQGLALLRAAPAGVLFSALVFGGAHAYQGARGMVIIGIYGALFSILTLLRRNLFPGMIAHSWHDFFTGMMLALIRSLHVLDRPPFS